MTSSLEGKRIVVTRAPHQADDLVALLKERGAIPLLYPCIDIVPPEDSAPLDEALRSLDRFNWLVLTSSNTVLVLSQRLRSLDIDLSDFTNLSVAAIGPSTAQAAQETLGITVDVVPDEHIAEALAETITPLQDFGVLLPQSEIARPILEQMLTKAGANVTAVIAYRTVIGSGGVNLPELLAHNAIDAITFTSSSTVWNFFRRLEIENASPEIAAGVGIVCIGPITAETARELGFTNPLIPDEYTLPGMISVLEQHFSELKAGA